MLQEVNHLAHREEYWKSQYKKVEHECNYNNVFSNLICELTLAQSLKSLSFDELTKVENIDEIIENMNHADFTLRIYQALLQEPQVYERETEKKTFQSSLDLVQETSLLQYPGDFSQKYVLGLAEKYL